MSAAVILPDASKRGRGRPKGSTKEVTEARYQAILNIALEHTAEYPQTLRHIYYLCSGQGIVGKDHGKETANYVTVDKAIQRARWTGDLDWDRIVDGTRKLRNPIFWENGADFLNNVVPRFALDKWVNQSTRVVLCIEKDAIAGMLTDVCEEFHVPLLSFRGQLSDSTLYELASHIAGWDCDRVMCYYMGDYDPSGLSIDRAIFGNDQADADEDEYYGKLNRMLYRFFNYQNRPRINYQRIGIIRDDLDNPAYANFIIDAEPKTDKYGDPSDRNFKRFVQDTAGDFRTLGIDALDAAELINRAKTYIESNIDSSIWDAQEIAYKEQLQQLQAISI